MPKHADLVAYDRAGDLKVVVEVKNKPEAPAEWARDLRRNLLVHGWVPRADYFVVAAPEHLYVWKQPAGDRDAPTIALDARELWTSYLGELHRDWPPSSEAFELIVASWLADLTREAPQSAGSGAAVRRVVDTTGLPDSIRGGRVEHREAA
jgi:hypothetical protein